MVGAGHNGLTAAAYLARARRSVLVLERNLQVGGACTLDQPFADPRWLVSPCAYVVGLLHPLVIAELDLARHGYRAHVADPASWCPFDDGRAFTEWLDPARTAGEVARLAPGDVEGYLAYNDVYRRLRDRLRAPGDDVWVGPSPSRAELEARLAGDAEAVEVVFSLSVAELIERHIRSPELATALHGGGVIGTWAGPRDEGTAGVRLLHSLGTIGGWGYVEGGMGRVSFALADAAIEAGAAIACGAPVAAIEAGRGARLAGGE
ncbi:MAG: phytoene desaturase family protein, partial [Acidimicrobiales bacterium]